MATATKAHNPIPYVKIAKLYMDGKSYAVIAQKTNRLNEKAPDPTKSVRAIVSRMITDGYTNEEGKTVKLKKRPGSRGMGSPKAAHKAVAKATKKVAKAVAKGKAIAIMVTEDGKHVKLTVPSLTTLVPIATFEKKVAEVLAAKNAPTPEAPAAPEAVPAEQPTAEAPVTQTPEAKAAVDAMPLTADEGTVDDVNVEELPDLDAQADQPAA